MNRPTVTAETVDGEVLMIHLGSGNYYSLRGTAAAIWDAVERQVPLETIVASVREHLTDDGTATTVEAFIAELAADDLVVLTGPDDSTDRPTECSWDPLANGPLSDPPSIEKFTDMQHLILLDPVHEVDQAERLAQPAQQRLSPAPWNRSRRSIA